MAPLTMERATAAAGPLVRPAGTGEAARVVATLTLAFSADPACRWMYPDPAQYLRHGAALMRPVLARCDAAGLPAYLEATSPRNRPLYERLGFEALGTIRVGDGPSIVPMLRRPPR